MSQGAKDMVKLRKNRVIRGQCQRCGKTRNLHGYANCEKCRDEITAWIHQARVVKNQKAVDDAPYVVMRRDNGAYYTGVRSGRWSPFLSEAKCYPDRHAAGCAVSNIRTPNIHYVSKKECEANV